MIEDHFKEHVKTWYDLAANRAVKICQDSGQNFAWVFEEQYAKIIIDYCAGIAEDCCEQHIPLSAVSLHIRDLRIPNNKVNIF
jgi:hypothetical protein